MSSPYDPRPSVQCANAALLAVNNRAQEYRDIAGVILVVLNKDGNITLLNRKGYEVLENEEGSLLGKNWFETCLPSYDRARVRGTFR